jgi:hypothetical protein
MSKGFVFLNTYRDSMGIMHQRDEFIKAIGCDKHNHLILETSWGRRESTPILDVEYSGAQVLVTTISGAQYIFNCVSYGTDWSAAADCQQAARNLCSTIERWIEY